MGHLPVYKVNFFYPEAKAIHCISYDEHSLRLAVARSDSSIELWDIKGKPYLEKVLPGAEFNSVEAISWCNGRLFSAGLHGYIIEYDLSSCIAKSTTSVNHGIWCLSVNEQISLIACGTEDGRVFIYEIGMQGLDLQKSLNKQEGRILCLAWHKSGDFIVTGSIDTIRIWDVKSGCVCERITVARAEKFVETVVWCVAFTSDMTVISGDSCGKTSFWDGKTGTLLTSFATHKADVLALCVSKDEKTVYTAGIDPVIIMHARLHTEGKSQKKNQWIKSIQRRIHSHDVRALALSGNCLISGGVDSYLCFSKYPPKTVIEFSPFSEISYSSVASEANLLLLRYPKHLELWKLKEIPAELRSRNGSDKLLPSPVKLLCLKSKSDKLIICSAISNDGKWIAFSTLFKVKVFFITDSNGNSELGESLEVKKLSLPEMFESCKCLTFISSVKLAILSHNRLCIISCNVDAPKLLMTIDCSSSPGEIINANLLSASPCGVYLACGTSNGALTVYDLEQNKMHSQLPTYKYQPTAISFDTKSEGLIVVYSDRKIIEYNLEKQNCVHYSLLGFRNSCGFPIRGILFPIFDQSIMVLYDDISIYFVELFNESEPEKKHSKGNSKNEVNHHSFRTVRKYKHLLGIHQFCDGKVLAVEMKPSVIMNGLPPPLYKKRYGM